MCFKPHGILKSNINKIKVQWVVLASHSPIVVMKFEFCARSARLLRKHDQILYGYLAPILDRVSAVPAKSKENFNDHQCFAFTLCP